jgi:hypothetical protein
MVVILNSSRRPSEAALIAQGLHFGGGQRLEIHSDSQILIEDLHAVYAADRGGYRRLMA